MGTNQKRRTGNRQQLVLLLVIALLVPAAWYYYRWEHVPEGEVSLYFQDSAGKASAVFSLEVAATPEQRQQGLMFRKELATRHGMIFLFPAEKTQSFWMKNTYISLDMIFLDKNLKVVGILQHVPVLNESGRGVPAQSQFVIEVAAGTVEREGITEGAVARFEGPGIERFMYKVI